MKKQFSLISFSLLALTIGFTACKKESKTDNNNTPDAEVATHSDDQSRMSTEVDAAAKDVETAIELSHAYAGRPGDIQGLICDAAISYDSTSNPRTITITYDTTNCFGNRTRSGSTVVSMAQGVQWKNAGASITVTFHDLKITRLSDNKSITLNGSQTLTNVTGGLLIYLPIASVTHTVTSDGMTITFDNGTQRTWKVAKQRVFTYDNGGVVSISGTHTEGNVPHVAEWGTNRFGIAFTTSTVSPVIIRQDCSFRVTGGELLHTTANYAATVSFGLDQSGNPTTCPGAGNYYFKLVWLGPNGNSLSTILPY